ncbi:bifunctional adenosylcobinamide kinase/adenosylcobinamide-phosphate guanylyltransferase [Mesobacillus subterraneus]|uniref:Adenosylcobinamide kinase n=1 Tax=Mesobacillus subterraneus TaxID=285983 RepID=A0A427TXQ8_9BACI|nr:bifunctional adenosylcobinamide kinase/adenosylcobinamide-phosphate guanylyltransferase [Mesobacillus subterraneus]RSD28945.1 bifunctional adenosylcobinamide kinase/adenosylcobinamide-phosphate guanylyltransferase [Mesobacillus subterraneus]
MDKQSTLIFISGGARSGKSHFAEILAGKWFEMTSGQLHYVAAGMPSDEEMEDRILRHKQDREYSGLHWRTWEIPRNLSPFSSVLTKNDIVLLDCLTTLLNNEFFQEEDLWKDKDFPEMIYFKILSEIRQVVRQARATLIVSNEVHWEPIGDHGLVLSYSRILGLLHQALVKECDEAYLVEVGIPILMKGEGIS